MLDKKDWLAEVCLTQQKIRKGKFPIGDDFMKTKDLTLAAMMLLLAGSLSGAWAADVTPTTVLPAVGILPADPTAVKGSSSGAFIVLRSYTTNTELKAYFTISGTASNGVDYAEIPASVTIPAGKRTVEIVITPLKSSSSPEDRYVQLTVATNAAYRVGVHETARVTIVENRYDYLPPVVALTSPVEGAVFHSTSIPMAATASDPDNAIAKVNFYNESRLVGSAVKSPYTFTWTNATAGAHTLYAEAVDATGLAAKSAAVKISVTNSPPVVKWVSPTNGTVSVIGKPVKLEVGATDVDDNVSQVSFYQDGVLVGSVAKAPYVFTWTNPPAGTHLLQAKATDEFGFVGVSDKVSLRVTNDRPVIKLISPVSGAIYVHPAQVTLAAQATDGDDGVNYVRFYADAKSVGSVTNPPYVLMLTNLALGSHTIYAKAVDFAGAETASTAVKITMTNVPPAVQWIFPTNSQVFAGPTNILLLAEVNDSTVKVGKISFYQNNMLIGSASNSPHSFTWSNVPPGKYTLLASASDTAGVTAISSSIAITVTNALPVVKLISPTNQSVFFTPTNITLTAEATDADDAIAKVSFYAGGKLLGSVSNAPYTLVWTNPAAGSYAVVAQAQDVNGQKANSQEIGIYVIKPIRPQAAGWAPTHRVFVPVPDAEIASVAPGPDGGYLINVTGNPAANAELEGSVDLLEWMPLGPVEITDPPTPFIDIKAGDLPCRFYRLAQP